MILFMVTKTSQNPPPDRYLIPTLYPASGSSICASNVQFISWNEVLYQLDERTTIPINNLDDLKRAVYVAALRDTTVCVSMIKQFKEQYGIDLPVLWGDTNNPAYHIIGDVFSQWAHPMIGNVVVSSGIRPQTSGDQYMRNWNSFPSEHMTAVSKDKIRQLIDESLLYDPESQEASKAGLRRLAKSSRDQVRCCKDMTELARAVIGEITTYATKKLEKIFALELCSSQGLLFAQREFIKCVVLDPSGAEIKVRPKLKDLFMNFDGNSIATTEYINFYFPQLSKMEKDIQWIAFIYLLNAYLDEDCVIPCDEPTEKSDAEVIDMCVAGYRKFPPVIRGAMIINAIRKFDRPPNRQRYTLRITHKPDTHWEIVEAPNSFFIPTLPKWKPRSKHDNPPRMFLWNWTRDEKDPATAAYREGLLPLWAGPSGHSAGLLDFYSMYLRVEHIIVGERKIPLSLIILPSMFAFWRLYYDKRICAVHTLAETFDAGFSHLLTQTFETELSHVVPDAGFLAKIYCEAYHQINVEAAMTYRQELPRYDDPFEVVSTLPYMEAAIPNLTGVLHPLRVMEQIRQKYYTVDGAIDDLDSVVDELRNGLSERYEVPRWAQPVNGLCRNGNIAGGQENGGFRGLTIRSFAELNVKVFGQNEALCTITPQSSMESVDSGLTMSAPAALPSHQTASEIMTVWAETAPAVSRLDILYTRICACAQAGKCYWFKDDFSELPACYTDKRRLPFLSALSFSDIRDCIFNKEAFTYKAVIRTDADFWNSVKGMVSLADTEEIYCTVTGTPCGLRFTGEIEAESVYRVTDKLSLATHRVILESGLDDLTCFPCVYVTAEIVTDIFRVKYPETAVLAGATVSEAAGRFDLTVVITPGSGRLYISGEYEDGKVLTMAGLLSLFGLDEVIHAGDLLPDQESVFGSLGLQAVTLTVDNGSVGITQIGFTITSGKPWNIFDNKITLQPYFKMNIEYPFDNEKRKAAYSVLGKWHIGSTVFDMMYSSDKMIYACLAEDSTLKFADVVELFAKDISFPAIELTGMKFSADVSSGNYSLYLSAEHVLEFEVGKAKLGIESLSFQLDFIDSKFGELKLGGAFALGGITLTLSGSYSGKGGLTFEAMAYSEEDYSLGDFITQAAQDFGQYFDRALLPDSILTVHIRMLTASYQSGKKAFHGYVDLEHVLEISKDFAIREIALEISSRQGESVEFQVIARIRLCGMEVELSLSKEKDGFVLSGEAVFENLTFGNIAREFGFMTDHLPDFILDFAMTKVGVKYNFTAKDFEVDVTSSVGNISAKISAGVQPGWCITYETDPKVSVDMLRMPLVGEMVQKIAPETSELSVKDFALEASSAEGVIFRCTAFGSVCPVKLYQPSPRNLVVQGDEAEPCDRQVKSSNSSGIPPETVKWINLNKTFAILTISKAGIGLDGSRVVLLLDASLALSPFTFSLAQAGAGINISRLSDAAFYLSGFGVAFDNGALAINGSFSRKRREGKEVYAGSLMVKCKAFTAMAVGEYSCGSLFAYMALSASVGGPPAFFVTGVALGFGYNKKLTLPSIEKVPEYPLIKAVRKGFDAQTLDDLNRFITEESRQNFLTAGVRFTSFKIVDGFLLLSVSFGKKFQIGVLGIADISMPPNAPSKPVARAQLALKAEYDPSAGVFSAEARLTSESYILSRDCKLTGGFAAFCWFDGSEHSGDFVITLGGYHPAFQKPAHYPEVPRLGLNWKLNSNLNISGEIYFALTPGAVMAGGKLSAVYTQGKLRAWFIAYADFIVSWKPFYYRAEIGVSLGASYRVDAWAIHKTFSIEMAAKLALWGPEVQGRLHVSWFIISFTISFSKGADHSGETLNWNTFKESFLQDSVTAGSTKKCTNESVSGNKGMPAGDTDILAVTVTGVVGHTTDGTDIIDPNGFAITLISKIPEQGNVRPVNNAQLKSRITLTVEDERKRKIDDKFRHDSVTKNVPAALWKSAPEQKNRLREESMLKDARCGISYELLSKAGEQELFPKSRFISLEELYRDNTLAYKDCFRFSSNRPLNLSDEDSICRFSQSVDSEETKKRRQKYLADNGITEQVTFSRFAGEAENWLAEELLIST